MASGLRPPADGRGRAQSLFLVHPQRIQLSRRPNLARRLEFHL